MPRYTLLRGPVSNVTVLTFGFIYNMEASDGLCSAVSVVPVAEAVASAWFQAALQEHCAAVSAVAVLAHMDTHNPLIEVIANAIRAHPRCPDAVPIQVIAGHSHRRDYLQVDARTAVFEPGNYFNTVGFASITLGTLHGGSGGSPSFAHADYDTSVAVLADATSRTAATFPTSDGAAFAAALKSTRDRLGLSKVLGCCTEVYGEGPALYDLYMERVAPEALFQPAHNTSQWFVQSTGGLRYSIYPGDQTTTLQC